jgi:hypothetical protein
VAVVVVVIQSDQAEAQAGVEETITTHQVALEQQIKALLEAQV